MREQFIMLTENELLDNPQTGILCDKSEGFVVTIVDNVLAVRRIVKYTTPMLWKPKKYPVKPSPSSPSVGVYPGEVQAQGVEAAALEPRVENVDVATRYPVGAFIIPKGYRVSGMVITSRPVVVEGCLEGPALVAPLVHVSASGHLKIPAQTANIIVGGVVSAPISARDRVEVQQGGVVQGSVEAGTLTILPGGVVAGAELSIGPLRGSGAQQITCPVSRM